MKSALKERFTAIRWLMLYVSLVMITFGYVCGKAFDWLSNRFPQPGPPNMFNGCFDLPAIFCMIVCFAGAGLCAICSIWILVAAVVSLIHRRHFKAR
jgi:hypothetical protein